MKLRVQVTRVTRLIVIVGGLALAGASAASASFVPSSSGGTKHVVRAEQASLPSTPTPGAPDSGQPASIQLTPNPLTIRCDGSDRSTVTVRVLDADGQPVPDGTTVGFAAPGGVVSQSYAGTRDGVVAVSVRFYGDSRQTGPNVIVDAGLLEAGGRVGCVAGSGAQPTPDAACPSGAAVGTTCAVPTDASGSPKVASSVGGKISFGTPTLSAGRIVVPVLTASSRDPYRAFSAHIRFDRSLLSAASAEAGDALAGTPQGMFCVPMLRDDSGDGVNFACTVLGMDDTSKAGALANFEFTPRASAGCALLHLVTYGPPDSDVNTGNFTVGTTGRDNVVAQQNTYGPDITIDLATGATGCTPSSKSAATATSVGG